MDAKAANARPASLLRLGEIIMKTLFMVAVTILLCSDVVAQTANYYGQTYTPDNFPKAFNCSCNMCQEIRRQWRATTPVVKQEDDGEYETRYRTEMRTETYQRKVCTGVGIFRRCHYVTDTRQVPVKVAYKVRKAPPKPEPEPSVEVTQKRLLPTPLQAIKRLLTHLRPTSQDIIIDAGSGDGRFLIEASGLGARAIGVEIDPGKVTLSRQRIRQASSTAIVFEGDATTFDYSSANIVYIYQYPDLLAKIVSRIPRGRRVVSYMHPIPGVETVRYAAGDGHVFFIGTVGGKPQSSNALTFGL